MKKILVPTDFSPLADIALQYAAGIALHGHTDIYLLHVEPDTLRLPLPGFHPDPREASQYHEVAAQSMAAACARLAQDERYKAIQVHQLMEPGDMYKCINKVIERERIGLVVMGTTGTEGLSDFFTGSNTEKIVRSASCPVLAVPDEARDMDICNVLFSTTLHRDQMQAFTAARMLQEFFDAEVDLLYLNNPTGFESEADMQSQRQALEAESGLRTRNLFTSENCWDEAATILKFAEEQKADLIVMGTHQRKGLNFFLYGSVAETTINYSKRPVLTVAL